MKRKGTGNRGRARMKKIISEGRTNHTPSTKRTADKGNDEGLGSKTAKEKCAQQ